MSIGKHGGITLAFGEWLNRAYLTILQYFSRFLHVKELNQKACVCGGGGGGLRSVLSIYI